MLRLHFMSVSIAKCWQATVFWSLMYYLKLETCKYKNSDPAGFYLGSGRIRIYIGSWDVGFGEIRICTGSTKSTGYPAGSRSGSGSGAPLNNITIQYNAIQQKQHLKCTHGQPRPNLRLDLLRSHKDVIELKQWVNKYKALLMAISRMI